MAVLLYVVGSGRSGSSLLDAVLGASPDISGTGELHRLCLSPDDRLCSCGSTIARCQHWNVVRSVLDQRSGASLRSWSEWDVSAQPIGRLETASRMLSRLSVLPMVPPGFGSWRQRDASAARRTFELVESIAEYDGSAVVVDSTKSPSRLLTLARANPRDVRAVYLVRDGRATADSLMRATGSAWTMCVLRWWASQRRASSVLRASRVPHLLVRYEDFCRDPLATVNAVRHLCELPSIDALPALAGTSRHMIPGNPVLLADIRSVTLDDRWKESHSSTRELVFRLIAGRRARRLGYR